jgi:hypothetical protein
MALPKSEKRMDRPRLRYQALRSPRPVSTHEHTQQLHPLGISHSECHLSLLCAPSGEKQLNVAVAHVVTVEVDERSAALLRAGKADSALPHTGTQRDAS